MNQIKTNQSVYWSVNDAVYDAVDWSVEGLTQ